jgi:hypothetical protein
MPRHKAITTVSSAWETVENFYDIMTGLGEEVRESYESMPENLKSSARADALNQAAEELEAITPDYHEGVVERLHGLPDVTYQRFLFGGKSFGRESRATRRNNAVSGARAVEEKFHDFIENERKETDRPLDMSEDPSEGAVRLVKDMRKEHRDHLDSMEEWLGEFSAQIDQAEGVEFPGPFG